MMRTQQDDETINMTINDEEFMREPRMMITKGNVD